MPTTNEMQNTGGEMRLRIEFLLIISICSSLPVEAKEPSPSAYAPYTRKGWENTFKVWGAKGMKRINEYRKKAAFSVASSQSCDNVEYAEFSDIRSYPPNNIVIYVDCRNGQRFYLTSDELDQKTQARSVSEKTSSVSDSKLIQSCVSMVQTALPFPSTFQRSGDGAEVYRAPQGNLVVTFNFTAKNAIGIDVPQRGRCVTDDRGTHLPEISNR